ncbi:MAG: DUF1292 domain-containing protein [Eubacteriales bacterium]|nr:DUF1292 domain-containing protein [Eubacteriales bacterium]
MSDEFNSNFGCSPSDCATCGGCGGGNVELEEHRTLTLTMEDDSEVECAIIGTFLAGEDKYIALLPLDENGQNQQGEVYLYTFTTAPDGSPMLSNIESDEEYAAAADAFNTWVEENARLVAESNGAE